MILRGSTSMLNLYSLSTTTPKLLSRFSRSSFLSTSPPSPPIRFIWLNQSYRRRTRAFSSAAVAVSSLEKTGGDTFFAEETVSWKSLGLSDRISQTLSNAGFDRPSLVQAACMPSILSGKVVVIAAETGSGKTYGYLVPLIDKLCSARHDGDNDSDKPTAYSRSLSVVLCPNVLLCEQVARMANDLSGDDGKPLLRVAVVCGRQGWPVNEPDVIVSTPVALLNNIDPKKHHRSDFIRAVKYMVFDEADMLLCGGFENHVIRLIHMFRFDEKLLSRMSKSGLENPVELTSYSVSHFDFEGEEDIQNESISDAEDLTEGTQTSSIEKKDWRRVRKYYERSKQYIFVAATLPVNGKKTAGAVLKKMFPDANWVSGSYLHQQNPRLKEKWVEVTTDTQVDALIEAVKQFDSKSLDHGAGVSRTMVFANTVEAVEAVANILQRAEIECCRYHKDLSLEERAESLDGFRERGGIFVCTDAAARGVDIPNVSHVIQADFATSAVDFLHRVGRTARAGQFGVVTCLYNESNRDLVNAIRAAGKLGSLW
ncbi:DEAD-box ATP-dependent RNA helicase 22-like [Hibiscus syriacus]|uniref:DEAD-box ATP-dependent RNA helicase 22-like n=1 Tax=Hibiscus syriacus TaxID=106335 RepID=UPI0019230E16|nr:DEAD-box ATP-dependent RNA helicase 22-like [Hibiscus syriacus]